MSVEDRQMRREHNRLRWRVDPLNANTRGKLPVAGLAKPEVVAPGLELLRRIFEDGSAPARDRALAAQKALEFEGLNSASHLLLVALAESPEVPTAIRAECAAA